MDAQRQDTFFTISSPPARERNRKQAAFINTSEKRNQDLPQKGRRSSRKPENKQKKEELQEKYIPATDEENPVRRKKWHRERKPSRLIKPEEDIPPSELAKRYSKGLSKMKFRIQVLFALCVVLLYLTIAADGTKIQKA